MVHFYSIFGSEKSWVGQELPKAFNAVFAVTTHPYISIMAAKLMSVFLVEPFFEELTK